MGKTVLLTGAPGVGKTTLRNSLAGRLAHFYGRDNPPRVRYVREKERLDYGKAHEDEYSLELLEDGHGANH